MRFVTRFVTRSPRTLVARASASEGPELIATCGEGVMAPW